MSWRRDSVPASSVKAAFGHADPGGRHSQVGSLAGAAHLLKDKLCVVFKLPSKARQSRWVANRGDLLGDTFKLRESLYSSSYQAGVETQPVARVMTSGMVKTEEIGQSAAKPLRWR
jgi:hypothetical protein